MTVKSAKKLATEKFTSPFGIARFPHISSPDVGGQKSDGKFKTALLFDNDEAVEKVRAAMKAAAAKLLPGEKFENLNIPLKELQDKDRDTGEKKSVGWGITKAHSKRRPLVLDAKKAALPEGVKIGAGSVIRIGGALQAYERAIDEVIIENGQRKKVKGVEKGLTLYLNSVQVKEHSAGGGASDGSEFDEVEGFEYDGSANTDATTDDATEL